MTPFNKKLIRSRFTANLHSYNQHAKVQEEICRKLALVLAHLVEKEPLKALEIGAGTGFLTRHLTTLYPTAEWYINDLVEKTRFFIDPLIRNHQIHYLLEDAEQLQFPAQLDLIATASTIQWFDDLPAFFHNCHKALSEEGLLAVTTFGKNHFHEITGATGEGLSYYSLAEIREMARKTGFKTIFQEEYTEHLNFDSPTEVLRHIKLTGVNGIRSVTWTKRRLEQFCADYTEKYRTSDEQVTLTYHPVIWIGIK